MESTSALLQGFAVILQDGNLLWAFVGVVLGTIVGILPGIGPALTVALLLPVTFQLGPVGGVHHVCRRIRRRHVRRIDHVDPHEYARRERRHDHRHRRTSDGQSRTGVRGAGNRGGRVFRGRHARRRGSDGGRAGAGRSCPAVRSRGVLRADPRRLRDYLLGARRLAAARPGEPVLRGLRWDWSASICKPGRRATRSASPSCWTASTSWWW